MMSLSRWKIFFVLFISLIGIVASLPPLIGPEKLAGLLPHWFPQRALTLGLDLQGGAHLLLEVDREKLLTDRYSVMLDSVRKALR